MSNLLPVLRAFVAPVNCVAPCMHTAVFTGTKRRLSLPAHALAAYICAAKLFILQLDASSFRVGTDEFRPLIFNQVDASSGPSYRIHWDKTNCVDTDGRRVAQFLCELFIKSTHGERNAARIIFPPYAHAKVRTAPRSPAESVFMHHGCGGDPLT